MAIKSYLFLTVVCVSLKMFAIEGVLLPVDADHLQSVTLVAVLEAASLPKYKTIFRPLTDLVSEKNVATSTVKVDCKICIENHSALPYVFGHPYSLTGYDCLEIDMKLDNGAIIALRRRRPEYLSDKGDTITVNPHWKWECLISLDERLWVSSSRVTTNKVVKLRPRFAFGAFKADGEHYRTQEEVKNRKKKKRDFDDREGELVGDWIDFPPRLFHFHQDNNEAGKTKRSQHNR